jgi:hypothetical protein
MSFEDNEDLDPFPQKLEGGPVLQLKYNRRHMGDYLKSKSKHFAVILHYLKTTHASVSSTNYDAHDRDFAVYHQYLNVFSKWSSTEYAESSDNQARTSVHDDAHGDSSHLCPLWPLNLKTRIYGRNVAATVTADYGRKNNLHTMRSSQQADFGPCRKWRSHLGADGNKDCISSGLLKTTDHQYPLESVLLMKNSMATIAPYDDIISPLVAPISDYAIAKNNYVDEDHVESVDMTLIVQSWVDALTIPEMHRKLMRGHVNPNQVGLQVNLKITNNAQISLPEISNKGLAGLKHMRSQNVDHSKWALSYPSGRAGTFPKLFCVSDLNRTFKHVKLDNSNVIERGRGGASICFSGGPLPELMYGLSPKLPDQTDGMYYDNLAPLYAGFKQEMVTVVGYSNDGSNLYLMNQLETRPDVVTVYKYSSPVLGVPAQDVPSLPLLKPADEEFLKIEGDVEFDQTISDVANEMDLEARRSLQEIRRSDYNIGSIFSYPITNWDYSLRNDPARSIYKIGFGFWFRLQESFQFAKNALLDLQWYQNILQYLPKPTKKRPKFIIVRKKTIAHSDDNESLGLVQKVSIQKPAEIPKKATVLINPKGKEIESEQFDSEATQSDSDDPKGKGIRPVSTPPKRTDRPFQPTILDAPKIQRIRKALNIARRKLEFENDSIASDASAASGDEVVSSKSESQSSEDNVAFLDISDEEVLEMPVKTQNKISLKKGK